MTLSTPNISVIASLLVEEYRPLLVLLVGSQALGYADTHSDIDLILITSDDRNLRQRVDHRKLNGTDVALEIYDINWVAGLVVHRGLESARELNRLRYGKILYDAGGWAARLVPSLNVVREVVGDIDGHFSGFETLLLDAKQNLEKGNLPKAAIQSECAANLAAILLTTLAGAGELPYSKPKWLRTALSARCNDTLVELYDAASFGESDPAETAQRCKNWLDLVSDLMPDELLQKDRSARRLMWLARKHSSDAVSIAPRGWYHARCPSMVSASFGLAALCRKAGEPYEVLPDAADLAARNGIVSVHLLFEVLFPRGLPSFAEATERFNAAVRFCIGSYGLAKASD